MDDQVEILVSGPVNGKPGVQSVLGRNGIRAEHMVPAHHGLAPEHLEAGEEWLAFRLPAPHLGAQHEALAKLDGIAAHGWRLRIHRLIRPMPLVDTRNVFAELAQLKAEIQALKAGRPYQPPMMGGALESPPWVISAAQHPASLFRQMPQSLLAGTGVVGSGDLLVTANSPTAMNVLVAAGTVWIPGTQGGTTGLGANAGAQSSVGNTNGGTSTNTGYPTSFTNQGNYFAYNDGQVTLAVASADPTNPRIDLVCASVQDAQYSGSSNQCLLQVITGTAGSSPAPAAPPANSMISASVWVPAAATSITSGDINDVRSFAGQAVGTGGAVNIATSQSRTNTAYGTLTTPDQVTVGLPTNGLIAVWYQATWQESVASAAQASLFLDSNQVEVAAQNGPIVAAAMTPSIGGTAGENVPLGTWSGGLASVSGSSGYSGDLSTGQLVGTAGASISAGPCYIFAAAGTHTVSVRFKASSGSVTASNRKLWAQALPFS